MAHTEHKLGGVIEAALSRLMYDDEWLGQMADDPTITQSTEQDVFTVLETYITEELALKEHNSE